MVVHEQVGSFGGYDPSEFMAFVQTQTRSSHSNSISGLISRTDAKADRVRVDLILFSDGMNAALASSPWLNNDAFNVCLQNH
jgi:riboflavin biosynthesis pyrimidine reductase